MFDFREIETFYWVATLGSFRAAAGKLNTTQPAISQPLTTPFMTAWRTSSRIRPQAM